MGNGNSRPQPRPPPPPLPPALPPAPYTHQLLNVGAHCASTAVSAGVGFDAAGCMQQAANHMDEAVPASMLWYEQRWQGLCFSLASASGACYVCESCESSQLLGHSLFQWWDTYSPPSPSAPPFPPMPPAPLESRLLAPDTMCTDRFDLNEHGGASGFDEQSCFDAAFAALYPA